MVMKIVRMREGQRWGRRGRVCDLSRTVTSMSSSLVLVRGIGAASVAGAEIRIGRVGEWKRGSRDRDAVRGGVRGDSESYTRTEGAPCGNGRAACQVGIVMQFGLWRRASPSSGGAAATRERASSAGGGGRSTARGRGA